MATLADVVLRFGFGAAVNDQKPSGEGNTVVAGLARRGGTESDWDGRPGT